MTTGQESKMDDFTQIRVGKHKIGIIGLKAALAETATGGKGMPDDQIADELLKILSKSNYIETSFKDEYAKAFLREFKKHIGEPVSEASGQELQIQILGPGCPQCERLEREVMAAMCETGIIAELEHVRSLAEIGRYGVIGSPALIINDEVKVVGSVPPLEKIKAWILQAAAELKHQV